MLFITKSVSDPLRTSFANREMRMVAWDHQMLTQGEYRVSPNPEGVKLVVQLGSVQNTDVAQRSDHLLVAAFLRPQAAEEETSQGLPIHLGPPIHLSAGTYARQLLTTLKRPLIPAEQPAPPPRRSLSRSHKPRRTTEHDASREQLLFFSSGVFAPLYAHTFRYERMYLYTRL
ncbi:MAG TPA: hypothetical protein VFV38_18870 [Ktedonobacteraceae bacterium]|nr:hypothetical protein [Ktedonobacteraceae bacterium]